MSKQIMLIERTPTPFEHGPILHIHVANDEVICHYTNVAIGPLIGILDALKDRLLEQQKNGTPQS